MISLRFLLVFAVFFLAGCAAGDGVYHTVGRGETLWRISTTYGVSLQELAEINDIKDTREIEKGRRLFIPGASRVRKINVPSYMKGGGGKEKYGKYEDRPEENEPDEKIVMEKDRFSWPVRGEIISHFGVRNGTRHDGIDIKAPDGSPVKAAGDGKAVFVKSEMRGYGNLIILKHNDDFFTVYAHNRENLVREGESVKKGVVIAKVGNSGNASVHHLHFEVRLGKKVRNPLFFLP